MKKRKFTKKETDVADAYKQGLLRGAEIVENYYALGNQLGVVDAIRKEANE